MPRLVSTRRTWSSARLLALAFVALAVLLLPARAGAAVPICSELAMSDFAPAPMVATRTAEIRDHRACEIPFGAKLDAADPGNEPSPPPPVNPSERGWPATASWPLQKSTLLPVVSPAVVSPFTPDLDGVFRPPRSLAR